jgi:hypothetical protein
MELFYYKEILDNISDTSTYAIILDLSEFLCNNLDYVQCRGYRFLLLVVSDELGRIEWKTVWVFHGWNEGIAKSFISDMHDLGKIH